MTAPNHAIQTYHVLPEQVDVGNDPGLPTLLISDIERHYVTETRTGLDFRDDTPIDVWGPLTARLLRTRKKIEFALADAINFGRRYGQKYSQWVHETGLADQSLYNIASVGRQIAPEIRHPDVDYTIQAPVAPLPAPMQKALIGLAVENGWNRDQMRTAVRDARAEIKAAERAALPVPETQPDCLILVGDARQLDLPDGCVNLFVTSPPYALDKEYGDQGDVAVDDWRLFIRLALTEAYRVAAPGARLALNVPLDTTRPYPRPTYAQALLAAQRAGWSYETTIVWTDDQLGRSTARGSEDSASCPIVITPAEMIVLLYKGDEWGRGPGTSDIAHQDWVSWTNGMWRFPGESRPHEDHPAAFPLALPTRLIQLLSFTDDLVCDPFCGSGTTALAAVQLGRRFYGVDRESSYVAAARRRVDAWRGV